MTSTPVFFRPLGALAALVLLASCAGSRGPSPSSDPTAGDSEVGDPIAVLQAAEAAAAKHPDDPEAVFAVGSAWQRRAELAGAEEGKAFLDSARVAYERVIEMDPGNPKALVHSGLVLEDLGRQDDALQRYSKATEVAPDDPRPYVNLGSLLYFHYRRTYDAKAALAKALELDPENADAHFNLGVLFADATLYREAQAEWERVAAGPDGPAKALAEQNLEKIRPLIAAQDSAISAASGAGP